MKWYSYSMPYLRVRVRVLLTRSTSTKSQRKTSIVTPKHANSATPSPLATGSTIVRASGRISSYSVDAGDKKKAACVQAAFEGLDLKV